MTVQRPAMSVDADELDELRRDAERLNWALPYLREWGILPLDCDGRAAIDVAMEKS